MTVVRIWQGTDKIYWVYRRSHGTREALKGQRSILSSMEKKLKIINYEQDFCT